MPRVMTEPAAGYCASQHCLTSRLQTNDAAVKAMTLNDGNLLSAERTLLLSPTESIRRLHRGEGCLRLCAGPNVTKLISLAVLSALNVTGSDTVQTAGCPVQTDARRRAWRCSANPVFAQSQEQKTHLHDNADGPVAEQRSRMQVAATLSACFLRYINATAGG